MTTRTLAELGMQRHHLFVAGEWSMGEASFEVRDKFTGERIADVQRASREQVRRSVRSAQESFRTNPLGPYERFRILARASELVAERRDRMAELIIAESRFTHADAEGEIDRCIQTLLLSAEEAKRITGEMVPIDAAPGQRNRLGFTLRVPIGVVCAITPFNSPLNTVAHKVGPALAAGNAVVLKPATYTPLTASALCGLLLSVIPYESFDEAIDLVNDSPYGLAAGVFTKDLHKAMAAAKRLEVGGVHINETSSSRVDLMPYGGVKASGFGREGPRYAIREMTEERLITLSWE